jgi:hypothetical protein
MFLLDALGSGAYTEVVHGAQENIMSNNAADLDTSDTTPELNSFLRAVGARIQRVREFRGISRTSLGEAALGLTGPSANTSVNAIETHGAGTRISTIYKIARVLEVSPGFLLDGGDLVVSRTEKF